MCSGRVCKFLWELVYVMHEENTGYWISINILWNTFVAFGCLLSFISENSGLLCNSHCTMLIMTSMAGSHALRPMNAHIDSPAHVEHF